MVSTRLSSQCKKVKLLLGPFRLPFTPRADISSSASLQESLRDGGLVTSSSPQQSEVRKLFELHKNQPGRYPKKPQGHCSSAQPSQTPADSLHTSWAIFELFFMTSHPIYDISLCWQQLSLSPQVSPFHRNISKSHLTASGGGGEEKRIMPVRARGNKPHNHLRREN